MGLPQVDTRNDTHPIDVIEEVAHANDWVFERAGDDEVAIGVGGKWTEYNLAFSWLADREALHLSCAWEVKVGESRFNELTRLLVLINERMILGHFDFWQTEGIIMFRQSLLLSGGIEPTERQIEGLLEGAVEACESYYQAFQYVIWSGLPAREALENVMFETMGTA